MATKAHHDPDSKWIVPDDRNNPKVTTFYPRSLKIVWGSDNRYWRLPKDGDPQDKNDQDQPAELIQVCWLEVTSTMDVEKGKTYKVTFELALKSDAFGWNGCQLYIMAKIGRRGKYKYSKVSLNNQEAKDKQIYPSDDNKLEVTVTSGEEDPKLYFGLYEVWSGKWKGGLKIYKALVTKV